MLSCLEPSCLLPFASEPCCFSPFCCGPFAGKPCLLQDQSRCCPLLMELLSKTVVFFLLYE